MTPPDRDKTGDAGEDLVDSSTGAPSKGQRVESDRMRLFADKLTDTGDVKRWLHEYADLLDRGVGQIRIDTDMDRWTDVVEQVAGDIIEKQRRADQRESHSDQMMVRSGNVHDPRPVVAFLYFLARDMLPVGDIESILIRLRELESDFGEYGFTNGWIVRWAQDAAERLGVTRSSPIESHDT